MYFERNFFFPVALGLLMDILLTAVWRLLFTLAFGWILLSDFWEMVFMLVSKMALYRAVDFYCF